MVTTREDLITHIATSATQSPTKQFKQLSALVAGQVAPDLGLEEFSARHTAIQAALSAHLPLPEFGWHFAWLRSQMQQRPAWWTEAHTTQVYQLHPIVFQLLLHSADSTMPQCAQFIADCPRSGDLHPNDPDSFLRFELQNFSAGPAAAQSDFVRWSASWSAHQAVSPATALGKLTQYYLSSGDTAAAQRTAQRLVLAHDVCAWSLAQTSAAVLETLWASGDHLAAVEFFARAKHLAEQHADPASLATVAALAASADQVDIALEILNEYPVLAARHATTWSQAVTAARCLAVVGTLLQTDRATTILRGCAGTAVTAQSLLQPLSTLVTELGRRFDHRHGNQVASTYLCGLTEVTPLTGRPLRALTRVHRSGIPARQLPAVPMRWTAVWDQVSAPAVVTAQEHQQHTQLVTDRLSQLTKAQWQELHTPAALAEAAAVIECVLTVSARGVLEAAPAHQEHQVLVTYRDQLTELCAAHRWPTSETVTSALLAALAHQLPQQLPLTSQADEVDPIVRATIRRLRAATTDPLAHPGACPKVLHLWLVRATLAVVDDAVASDVVADFLHHAAPLAQLTDERARSAAAHLLVAIAQQPHWVPAAVSAHRLVHTAQKLVPAERCPHVHFVAWAQQLKSAAATADHDAVLSAIGQLAELCARGQVAGVWSQRSAGETWFAALLEAAAGTPDSAQEWLREVPAMAAGAAAGGDADAAYAFLMVQAQVYAKAGLRAVPTELLTHIVTSFDPFSAALPPTSTALQIWFSAAHSLSQILARSADLAGAHQLLSTRLDRAQCDQSGLAMAVRHALSAQSAAVMVSATLTDNAAAIGWVQQTVKQVVSGPTPPTTVRLGALARLFTFWWRTALAVDGVLAAEQVLAHWAEVAATFGDHPTPDDAATILAFSGPDLGVAPLTSAEFTQAQEQQQCAFLQAAGRYLQAIDDAEEKLARSTDSSGVPEPDQVDQWLSYVIIVVAGLARVGKLHQAQSRWRAVAGTLAALDRTELVELSQQKLTDQLQAVGLPAHTISQHTPENEATMAVQL